VGATLSPLVRDPHDDGFPLSTYPMFATPRQTQQVVDYPIGETITGERRRLSAGVIGSGEVLQALGIVAHAVGHAPELPALCARIASAVAADDRFADVVTIRIVTGEHDAVAYFVDGAPGVEHEHARCKVPR
jgi:hypothetical protein